MRISRLLAVAAALLATAATACGGEDGPTEHGPAAASPAAAGTPASATGPFSLTLYTSVTQNTVDAVVEGFTKAYPGSSVDVFRATTGDLNARIAADERSGGLRADVIWGTDPLSMQSYADQDLLAPWPLGDIDGVPTEYQAEEFWGTRVLTLVLVANNALSPKPESWSDLTDSTYRDKVALPNPAAAGSAFAALGYFSQAKGFGMDFYRDLKANGAVQVATVPEVVTDVATGRYQLGITLSSEVVAAMAKGSPVTMVWPKDGAIALYSPIAATSAAKEPAAAEAWMRYVLSTDGQERIAATGWQPVLEGIEGPERPAGATVVAPDWSALFGGQRDLLAQYQAIFGG